MQTDELRPTSAAKPQRDPAMRTMRALACSMLALVASSSISLAATAAPAPPLSLAALLSPQDLFPLPTPPPRPFLCVNAGSYTRHLPLAMVGDGVCDCCDGSDENIKGGNPWFATGATEGANKNGAAAKGVVKDAAQGAAGGGGWLSSLLSSDSGSASAPASVAATGPCPNTCLEHGASFLAAFSARVADYSLGVHRKHQRLQDLPRVHRALATEQAQLESMFEQAVDAFHHAVALHEDPRSGQNRESYEALMEAQHVASSLQAQLEQIKWMQGQTVAAPGSRPNTAGKRPVRPAGNFGPQSEWLLFWDTCLPFEWAQRRWGHFGESVDWYRMQLCPLQNATQQALSAPTPKLMPTPTTNTAAPAAAAVDAHGTETDVAATEATSLPTHAGSAAEASVDNTAPAAKEEEAAEAKEEEAPKFVLGWWTGEIAEISGSGAGGDRNRPTAAADTDGRLSAAAASDTAPTSRSPPSPPSPAPGAWGAPPPGSVLASTPEPRFILSLRGGDNCWGVGPRQAEIEVQCGGGGGEGGEHSAGSTSDATAAASASSATGDRVLRVEEDGKCRYRFVVASSLACSADHLALMQAQLRDYRAWFARKAPQPSAPRTVDEHWARHDEL